LLNSAAGNIIVFAEQREQYAENGARGSEVSLILRKGRNECGANGSARTEDGGFPVSHG